MKKCEVVVVLRISIKENMQGKSSVSPFGLLMISALELQDLEQEITIPQENGERAPLSLKDFSHCTLPIQL